MPAATQTVAVVGLGAMGSAAAFHLANRGVRVIGFDRFRPPHAFGSSTGQTRIIREAYFEHPAYVPLVQRAYALWDELARRCTTTLFQATGGLMIGAPNSVVVQGARRSAQEHGLEHQVLTAAKVRSRFPALHPTDEMIAVWEPRAGVLFPERCIAAHLHAAAESSAVLRTDEQVIEWSETSQGVKLKTDQNDYTADHLVISAGAWVRCLVPELRLNLSVERQVQFWFGASTPNRFSPDCCPIHLWEDSPGKFFYGFPDLGEGVKVAGHHEGEITDPDRLRRDVTAEEGMILHRRVRPLLPALDGTILKSAVCMYTNTPHGHFLLDFHPGSSKVLIASPCSGHGFKFASAIGSVIADLLITGSTAFDLELFRYRSTPPPRTQDR